RVADPNAGNDNSSGTELNDNRRAELRVTYSVHPGPIQDPPKTVDHPGSDPVTTTRSAPGSDGAPVAIAAAVAINLPDSATSATTGGGAVVVAPGAVAVRGRANPSDLALADGSAVTAPGGHSIGAAVAINAAETTNSATIAGATVTGDGVTVEAVMLP